MTPRLRRFVLTTHITSSVGWLGAVVGSLALGAAALTSGDAQTVRGAYLALEAMGWFVLVPLAFASLLTGLVQSLGTEWGLFRHYWILSKLFLNVFAVVVLLLYMQTLSAFSRVAAETISSGAVPSALRSPSVVIHTCLALLGLLVATVLSVYKPRGMTRYGQRKQHQRRARSRQRALTRP